MTTNTPKHASSTFSNRTYDVLKYIAQIVLPASGALYFGLAEIWELPYGTEVVGTITVVDVFLGAVLLLSSKQYNNSAAKFDGTLNVIPEQDKLVYRFDVERLEDLTNKQVLTIRVDKPNRV